MIWGRSFICSRETEHAFEPNIAVKLLPVDRFQTIIGSRETSHQVKFGDPNLASLSELKGCLLQVNLDSCIEIPVILHYSAHQAQYRSFHRCCESRLPTAHYPVHFTL